MRHTRFFLTAIALTCAIFNTASAQIDSLPFVVKIGHVQQVPLGDYVTLDVTLEHAPFEFSAFDFTIDTDASALFFQDASPGERFFGASNCDWEYFKYGMSQHDACYPDKESCHPGTIKFVGFANSSNTGHPNCYQPDSIPAVLFSMRYLVTSDRNFECDNIPVRFLWGSCADNTFSTVDGTQLVISNRVFDYGQYGPIDITDPYDSPFPTYQGAQFNECDPGGPPPASISQIEFYNGMVGMTCANHVDWRGDINLNGLAFEVADWMIFADYFIRSYNAFQINPPLQMEASDINEDGHTLTLEDLVFMANFMSSGPPGPMVGPPDSVVLDYDQTGTLSVQSRLRETLGAIQLFVEGEIHPVLEATQMEMTYAFDSGQTYILITSLDISKAISEEAIVTLPGAPRIVYMDAASSDARDVIVNLPSIPSDRMTIEIGSFEHFDASKPISISVNVIDGHQDIGGFNFLLSYDASILEVESVEPGLAISEAVCGWRYFGYRLLDSTLIDPATGDTLNAGGLLRVVGIANVNGNSNCYLPDSLPAELFKINFNLKVDRELVNCVVSPVRFYWTECGDNSLASYNGGTFFIADTVMDWRMYPNNIANPNDPNGYPTSLGPQDADCLTTDPKHFPTKALTLINGGIDFICIGEPFDYTGDVNLNGIAYEIADWVVFSWYFTEGTSVFIVNDSDQVRATDVTYDGIPLTIYDFVYLGRVIMGDALPLPGPSNWEDHQHGSGNVEIDPITHTLSISTAEHMGGAYFVLAGEVTPTLLKENMELSYAFDPPMHQTYVLISSLEGATFTEGALLGNVTTDMIYQMEIATHEGFIIDLNMGSSEPPYTIRLSVPDDEVYQGQLFTANINMDPSAYEMGGFDLMIQSDPEIFSLRSVQPGSLITNCDWEYFTYREGLEGFCDNSACPSGVIRIVALADLHSQLGSPSCFGAGSRTPSQLASIEFMVSNLREYDCSTQPLRFLWYECKDNTLASRSGEELFISARVFDIMLVDTIPGRIPFDITNHNDPMGYPTIHGSQTSDCMTDSLPNHARPLINFYNELVNIACAQPLHTRGDINYNQIPFEIADWVLFSNYFIYGVDVFSKNRAAQVLASDVNSDGIVLALDDFVYMMHVITSGYEPIGGDPDSVIISLSNNGTLAVQSDLRESIGAIHLVIEGDVSPVLLADQMEMAFDFDGVKTSILLHSPDLDNAVGKEEILTLPATSEILSIEAATIDAHSVKIEVDRDFQTGVTDPDGNLPNQFALRQNYPNPFNPSTSISFDLPRASEVVFEVLNIIGQTVYRTSAYYSAGSHTIEWNADQSGRQVASGIYYYRIEAGDFSESRKMILLK